MSLELIVGPPNSGRAGAIMARLRDRLGEDPFLVVPTSDEVARFERDLCAGGEAVVGATIRTFGSLFTEVAARAAVSVPPPVSTPQRLALVRSANTSADLRVLRRSARAVGFAPALDSLIAELGAALVSPEQFARAAEPLPGGGAQERELAALYRRYRELLVGAGRADDATVANAALDVMRENPDTWGRRPVLVYGFDDLTEAQLALLASLARTSEVTVAVTYADSAALAARAGLLRRLLDEGGEVIAQLSFDGSYTDEPDLRHVAATLFEPEVSARPPTGSLRLMECAGERGEAEAVAIEVARLMTAGTKPDDVVIVLRSPAAGGRLFARILRELGVPATLEADISLAETAVGGSLIALCHAVSEDARPSDVLAHLRADPAAPDARADWAERAMARGEAEDVAALIERWGERPPPHLARAFEATGDVNRIAAIAVCARRLAEAVHSERAPLVGERSDGVPFDPLEMRAALAAADLLSELASVASLPGVTAPRLDDAAEAIAAATVRAWHGPSEGRVRILSPYRARGTTATHLFCCSLEEGVFPGRGQTDPLLGEDARRDLGIPALVRAEQNLEERYLFHACLTRPTKALYLSWRSSDEEGHPLARSPFIDEVVDLFGDDAESTEQTLTQRRGLAQAVPSPHEATTPRSLARSLVARLSANQDAQRAAIETLECDLALAGDVLDLTARVPDPDLKPGPLAEPAVLAELGSRDSVSANSLEGWIECSYKWFVGHELKPQRLEPTADPLWLGGVVHSALQELYEEPPGSDSIPRPDDVNRWKARFRELIAAAIAEPGREASTSDRSVALARVIAQVEAFLDEEARSETELRPRPELLERSFGFPDRDGDPGALRLGDFTLRGFIDRIDVAPDGRRAVIRDYKTSKSVPGLKRIIDDGKLQLPLYMLAASELLGLDPVAGLYHPLASYGDRRARGIALREETDEGGVLEHAGIVTRGDAVDVEGLEHQLERAREIATDRGALMRAGAIARNPMGGRCPKYCTFQPICRLERAIGVEEETANGGRE
ncbi:hypothetical protein BH24ACT23_BH24ACT23_00660 [soil metagenome]